MKFSFKKTYPLLLQIFSLLIYIFVFFFLKFYINKTEDTIFFVNTYLLFPIISIGIMLIWLQFGFKQNPNRLNNNINKLFFYSPLLIINFIQIFSIIVRTLYGVKFLSFSTAITFILLYLFLIIIYLLIIKCKKELKLDNVRMNFIILLILIFIFTIMPLSFEFASGYSSIH